MDIEIDEFTETLPVQRYWHCAIRELTDEETYKVLDYLIENFDPDVYDKEFLTHVSVNQKRKNIILSNIQKLRNTLSREYKSKLETGMQKRGIDPKFLPAWLNVTDHNLSSVKPYDAEQLMPSAP